MILLQLRFEDPVLELEHIGMASGRRFASYSISGFAWCLSGAAGRAAVDGRIASYLSYLTGVLLIRGQPCDSECFHS